MPSFSATTGGAAPVADGDRSVGPVVSRTAHFEAPLALACGRTLPQYDLAYETYGELDAARTRAHVEELLAGIPLSTALEIAGAGHSPQVDSPEAFARGLRDFLLP